MLWTHGVKCVPCSALPRAGNLIRLLMLTIQDLDLCQRQNVYATRVNFEEGLPLGARAAYLRPGLFQFYNRSNWRLLAIHKELITDNQPASGVTPDPKTLP